MAKVDCSMDNFNREDEDQFTRSIGFSIFIIIPHPLEAVGSLLFTKAKGDRSIVSDELSEEVLDSYVRFHSFLLVYKGRYRLLCLPDILDNLGPILREISLLIGQDGDERPLLQTIHNFDRKMKDAEKGKGITSGSLPSSERETFKNDVRARILEFRQYRIAEQHYLRLVRT